MKISRTFASVAAIATTSALAFATPGALARSTKYVGKTREGDPISFRLSGSKLTQVKAYVPTLCLATEGLPLSGTDPFDPPGSFRLGTHGKAAAKRPNAIWNTSDVTKNFEITTKRGRHGVISGKLHSDFSFLMILYTYPISARPYVCTGDTTFKIAPKS
jgi:hypothetical protein